MKIQIVENENKLSAAIAEEIENVVSKKQDALMCLCAGHSPVPVMKQLVRDAQANKYPADSFRFLSLDEWVGLGIEDPGSCIHDVSKYFLEPLALERGERMFFFDGQSDDLQEECDGAQKFIEQNGGAIDVILLGIGMNGHIGFNEPGTKETDGIRVVTLSQTSKTVGVKYFDKDYELTSGITIGIPQIMQAKKVIVMAFGEHKADIVEQTIKGEKTVDCPVTLIRDHADITFYFDKAAAKKIV
ncbi:MAG: glucosamine-6-phosphate deaminase [Christensenella sp.]|uniref:6-phosphogluconolactonase n=1 Tax=Christensenella sp. TaxID=1935934 RepID=UPI002B1F5BE8|nr:glucosamine-6-phosphate deaminase [Christensenella sp.]MEA5004536.1 glucosamine-6-phosphate deaminase [Christensenella sp.]